MDRRLVLSMLGTLVLAGCGGGGGGGASDGAPAAGADTSTGGTPSTFNGSPKIAGWGDSLMYPVAMQLQNIWPAREVFDGGVIGETSTQIAARQLADSQHLDWINVFWYGHNNQTDSARIKADIAASVAHLAPGNDRYVVMSVVNQATWREIRGGPDYPGIMQLDSELAQTYGDRFLDIRNWLVAQYNRNDAGDIEDFNNDVVPRSLRAPDDPIHLNWHLGSLMVAQRIKAFIEARGW